jgi:hypothetical protein
MELLTQKNNIKNFLQGIRSYLICNSVMSLILTIFCVVPMIMGAETEFETIYDVLDLFYSRYYYTGSLLGAPTWQWHGVFMIIAGSTNYVLEKNEQSNTKV